MAMSKLIGVILAILAVVILFYSMYEMHRTQDLTPMPNLLIGIFGLLTAYVGFYINMAKAEHIEDKKNQIKKELEIIKKSTIQEKEMELQQEFEQMDIELEVLKTQY